MRFLLAALLLAGSVAHARSVAVTMDDLHIMEGGQSGCDWNYAQSATHKLTAALKQAKAPAVGFVVAGTCSSFSDEQRRTLFRMWQDAGAELGNHTYSHPDLDKMTLADFESDILRAGETLQRILGPVQVRWFRSPFLHTGADAETKAGLSRFLAEHKMRESPVTVANSDWVFTAAYRDAKQRGDKATANRVKNEYLAHTKAMIEYADARETPQILLVHANELNADALPSLLRMLRKRGYQFITLEEALKPQPDSRPVQAAPASAPRVPQWIVDESERINRTR